jgi:hypothetical protein
VLAARLRIAPGIRVVNYGCPGESTVTFARGGCPSLAGDRKLHDAFRGSRVDAAPSFARAHPGEVGPIAITLWRNDIFPLSQKGKNAPSTIASGRVAPGLDPRAAPERRPEGRDHPQRRMEPEADPLYRAVDAAIARAAQASRARVGNAYAMLEGEERAGPARAALLPDLLHEGRPEPGRRRPNASASAR